VFGVPAGGKQCFEWPPYATDLIRPDKSEMGGSSMGSTMLEVSSTSSTPNATWLCMA
jgi:hypothetical protein